MWICQPIFILRVLTGTVRYDTVHLKWKTVFKFANIMQGRLASFPPSVDVIIGKVCFNPIYIF